MGYSKSLTTLEKFYQFVQPLEKLEPYTWITEPGASGKVAYKVREALFIAACHPGSYPALALAAQRFNIHELPPSKVEARLTTAPTEAGILSGASSGVPQHGGTGDRSVGRSVSTAGEQTVFTIIEAWRRSQPSNTPIVFTHAKLSDTDLEALWQWAEKRTPKLMIMLGEEGTLTLGPVDDQVVEFAYRPPASEITVDEPLSDEAPNLVIPPPPPRSTP